MNIQQQFASSNLQQEIGLVTGSASALQFPNRACVMLRLKAKSSNNAAFFVGTKSSEQLWELAPGDDTGWVTSQNLNQFYFKSVSGSMDGLAYWLQR